MFTPAEQELLIDAIHQSLASNKRMINSKPKFKSIFEQIETDLIALKHKVQAAPKTKT